MKPADESAVPRNQGPAVPSTVNSARRVTGAAAFPARDTRGMGKLVAVLPLGGEWL